MSRWKSFGSTSLPKKASTFISKKIRQLVNEGYPQQQAIAIAYSEARKRYPHMKGLKKDAEPSWHEWKYYGGEARGEPEPKDKYY
jgi:hypothetical protein